MRIRTNTLTEDDIRQACIIANMANTRWAKVGVWSVEPRGCRSHDHAFELTLEGAGRINYGKRAADGRYFQSASRDQWGWVIRTLFRKEPGAIIGPYRGEDDFHAATYNQYANLPLHRMQGKAAS